MDERWANNPGCLTAWVEAGTTRTERNKRLEQVPEQYREQVRRQVETAYALKRRKPS